MDTLAFYVVMALTHLFTLVVTRRLNLTYSKYSRVPVRRRSDQAAR
jgi:hypothetical protein